MNGETYPERPEGYPEWTEELLIGYFKKYMSEEYGVKVDRKYMAVIEDMLYGILTAKQGELAVIPAFMGLGKSTLLMVVLKFMASTNPKFGCVIVKERIEDMLALERELGYVDDEYGEQKIARSIHGFHQSICKEGHKEYEYGMCGKCKNSVCEVKTAFEEQYSCPVVLITHERLFREADTVELLDNFKQWKDEKGDKRKRQYIFIDERPKFFSTYKENWALFDVFTKQLNRIAVKLNIKVDIEAIVKAGNERFNSISNGEALLFRDEEILSQLDLVKKTWWKSCPEQYQRLYPMYRDFFSNGGYKSNGYLMTFQYTDYTFKNYATIILDGTAKEDMIYPDNSKIIGIEDFRKFENLTLYHCNEFNLSKKKLEDDSANGGQSKEQKLSIIIPEIIEISRQGKTLVLCALENEEVLSRLLVGIENIAIAHFNAVKGSNKFLDCTNIFFAGTMDFGDGYYILKALAIDSDEVDTFETQNTNKLHSFKCEFINRVERNDKERYILQDIFRTAIRKIDNKEPINVYLFQTDDELVRIIQSSLVDCTVKIWTPIEYRMKVAPRETEIINYVLSQLKDVGDEIRKKQIELECNISRDFRKEVFKRPRVKQIFMIMELIH